MDNKSLTIACGFNHCIPNGTDPQIVMDAILILASTIVAQYAQDPVDALKGFAGQLGSIDILKFIESQKRGLGQ